MSTIARYNVQAVVGKTSTPYTAPMVQRDDGKYVTYASHDEEMSRLQGRIDALELMQKDDFFYHARPILDKCFTDAAAEVQRHLAMTKVKIDPCNELVKKFIAEFGDLSLNTTKAEMFMIEPGESFINDAHIEGGFVSRCLTIPMGVNVKPGDAVAADMLSAAHAAKDANHRGLKCIKSDASYFTPGKSYDYEIRNDVYVVVQDDHVSDLGDGDGWQLEDSGAYLMMSYKWNGRDDEVLFAKPHGLSKRFGK